MKATTQEIAIQLNGRIAICSPLPAPVLETLLYREQSYTFRAPHGQWLDLTTRLYTINPDGSVNVPAGSVPRLSTELQRHGHLVTIDDRRSLPPAAREHDAGFYAGLNDGQRRLCDTVIHHRQFVLATTPQAAFQTMGFVARLYPKARIFIAVLKATTAACNQVMLEMAKFVGGNVGRAVGIRCLCRERVAVGSHQQFSLSNPEDWDIILFPDAERAVTKYIADGAGPYQNHRFYGFINARRQLSNRGRLWLEALAGPIIFDNQNGTPIAPTITVLFCGSRTRPLTAPVDPLQRKRIGIWQNATRNRLIADVAMAFSTGDDELLGSLFRIDREPSLFRNEPRSLAIVVESPEHGRALSNLLPEWNLLTATNLANFAQSAHDLGRTILTSMAAIRSRNFIADVLIRADGGEGSIQPLVTAPQFGAVTRGILIVDFADDFDTSFLDATHARMSAYTVQGWNVSAPDWLMQPEPIDRNFQKIKTGHRVRNRRG